MKIATMITHGELPGAHFASAAAVTEHSHAATRYENVVAAFDALDETALCDGLRALGFDAKEVQWHLDNPGRRMRQGYV
jgi:hypothetical protein